MNYISKLVSETGTVFLAPMRLLISLKIIPAHLQYLLVFSKTDSQVDLLPVLSGLVMSIDQIYQEVANLSHRDCLYFITP